MVKAKGKRPTKIKKSAQAPTAPLHPEPTECHDPYSLDDDEIWLLWMEPVLCDNPDAAEAVAHLLFTLKRAIESGPEGTARALFTIDDGIRIAYKYTETHKTALRLYRLYLAGELNVEDQPLQLITAAISRRKAKTEKAKRTVQASPKNES